MVSLSKLFSNSLIYSSSFHQAASPALDNTEQYNIAKFLVSAGPYFEYQGFGISTDLPVNCTLEQVQLFMRHGERYPTTGSGTSYNTTVQKIKSSGTLVGPLSFINDYEFYIKSSDYLEMLTTPENSNSPYLGSKTAMEAGIAFRSKYGILYNDNIPLPVFSTNSQRVYDTAHNFINGFMGEQFSSDQVKFNVISTNITQGFNSLTPTSACAKFNTSYNSEYINAFPKDFLSNILARLEVGNPTLNITTSDIGTLFNICAFELSNTGGSQFCGLFTDEELITNNYLTDLNKYFTQGPGNPLANAIGYVHFNASMALLKDEDSTNKMWLSFFHDSDLCHLFNGIGLFDTDSSMSNDRVKFHDDYQFTQTVTMAGRVIIEKFKYADESYVRFLVNNAVIPLKTCSDGPGFSCKLSDLEDLFESKYQNYNLTEVCGANTTYQQDLTFFWDWSSVSYNATTSPTA
ncbi:acid phosphatase [Yamadazyma tenuis]|uniref:Uncharacterized protein n=1 Tax=Candida tenuis (strain ATCC 10573 / BCRC 21748 / CBS 615 / JCM 9827 / NBRC 10315 / NRRL Y-1498 / VKM Y-70) TaxID=590646 RepID=G3B8H6_CANTC|nr:uncharacterized protein CANTEDRAFT_126276 [Yamadazyma tenuis ATCC 10573]EGV62396.1 hypothetical protein CANTEDRAFT_126276 [Yamadazyma tenuis ATCC 10573]WEJ93663.1 acid phosphatase [Yamadazyma tenuis]